MKKLPILILLLGILAILPLGCSQKSNDTDQTNTAHKSVVDDASITTKVKAKFADDELVKARNIDVDTRDGQVELRGTVTSDAEAQRAVQIAQNTEGVRTVHSFLKTEQTAENSTSPDTSSSTTQDLKDTAKNDLNAAKDATKDAAITAEIKTKFASDKLVDASHISVDTNNGSVTLSGTVKSKAEERRALQIARNVDDVQQVHSELTIQ